jgi:hypothetical protein
MDLVYYLPNWLASIVFIIGFFSSAIVLIWIFNVITHYFKYKSYPLHPIEYRYINLLEENKQLKQKIIEFENQQEQIFNEMIEQLKEK